MKLGDVARNPLGIIGLFISLVYGFANWMLGSTANTLLANERIVIIWFIVLFPVLILVAFCYLVVKHHGKLYAPKDYSKDESFLQTLSPFDSFVRLTTETFGNGQEGAGQTPQGSSGLQVESYRDAGVVAGIEVQSIQVDADSLQVDNSGSSPAAEQSVELIDMVADESAVSAGVVSASTDNDVDLIEHAKKQKQLSQIKEVFELTQHFIDSDERFAGFDVKPNVKMGATGVVYDAAAYTGSGLQCLEVKYLRSVSNFKNLLIKYINQARVVRAAVLPADFHLRLVIIYDWDIGREKRLRTVLSELRPMLQDFVRIELVARASVDI